MNGTAKLLEIRRKLAHHNESVSEAKQAELVAVSKTKPISQIQDLYDAGQRIFGENKVQELLEKHPAMPSDIAWHMIGHLQRNKVKLIAPFIAMIHGVDSARLAIEINKQAALNNRVIPILLQVHIANEQTKFGFSKEEIIVWFEEEFSALKNISVCGLMGMATFTDDQEQVRSEFCMLSNLKKELVESYSPGGQFRELSMGMSGDFEIALQEGATMVRIGSMLFGAR
ncbi:MAG: pyridoxal phosphate enzyme (YggS family) [Limisphaerales bacterium]|jgi:pyridoxal phosphate enzyme (YggS family)